MKSEVHFSLYCYTLYYDIVTKLRNGWDVESVKSAYKMDDEQINAYKSSTSCESFIDKMNKLGPRDMKLQLVTR